jgi:hypothetical protein
VFVYVAVHAVCVELCELTARVKVVIIIIIIILRHPGPFRAFAFAFVSMFWQS